TYEELAQRVKDLEAEKLQANLMKGTLIKSEEWLSDRMVTKRVTEIDESEFDLGDIINVDELQAIMDDFFSLTNMVTAILDLKGNVIESTGWQDICTKFHRLNPKARQNCKESDLLLAKRIKPGEYVDYKCKNGLTDVVTPLYVGTKHLGNIYTGQFFYDDEHIEEEFFIRQAEKYGFDKESYITAFRKIPRYSREKVGHLMDFLAKFATYISKISLANIKLKNEIDERRRAEDALRKSEERLNLIIKGSNDAPWDWDLITNDIYYSPQWFQQIGYMPEELANDSTLWERLMHPDDKDRVNTIFKRALKSNRDSYEFEFRLWHKNGSYIPVLSRGFITRDKKGDPVRVTGTNMDLSERKRTEELLRESESNLRAVLNATPFPVAIANREDNKIVFWSNSALSLFGHVATTVPEWYEMAYPDPVYRSEVVARWKPFLEKGGESIDPVNTGEYVITCSDGSVRICEVYATFLQNMLVATFNDITSRVEAENKLKKHREHLEEMVKERTEALEAKNKELETFTYSVSHDLKAPLRGIDGYSRLLLEEYKDKLDDDGRHFLNNVINSTQQMNQLIEDLLSYSRMERRDVQPVSVDLISLIDMLFNERAQDLAERHIEVISQMPFQTIFCDRESIRQILGNILDNAIKFTCNKSSSVIKIKGQESSDAWIISVEDNGIGFDPKYQQRIFGIFQRLHHSEDYPGTGVGLAIVKKAVNRMSGKIWAESEPGKGAVFHLQIPKH
ncbi:MAG: PocR ligand-binding domain-containing protein, partial [Desulfamplus sp.]|nr:PocR ligand-binding domain-containing protein [Desulfamplus sp.]